MSNHVPRLFWAAGAAVCALLLGYGYFLQHIQGLEPCPLCLVQRAFFYAVMAVFAIAAVHRPARAGSAVYAALITIFAIGGLATASRQVWLQHLPADQVPQCGPDLFFMLENLPLAQTLKKLAAGSGECAKVDWTFLGFSIAEWSLACFAALIAYAAWLALRGPRRAAT
jgi:protein dithiol:quinone oxidoreductase